ncbi:MAG TPA: RNase adapter RapZ [Candidatus Obscuribacterales bacterium]
MQEHESTQVTGLRQPKGKQAKSLSVSVISFGYKEGAPPPANMVFDMRFLKNPFWVPELRPLTGLDAPVKEYVLTQPLAVEFLQSLLVLLGAILPRLRELEIEDFAIAFGCTGGQHRSAAIAEAVAERLGELFPDLPVWRQHRELKRGCDPETTPFRDERAAPTGAGPGALAQGSLVSGDGSE